MKFKTNLIYAAILLITLSSGCTNDTFGGNHNTGINNSELYRPANIDESCPPMPYDLCGDGVCNSEYGELPCNCEDCI